MRLTHRGKIGHLPEEIREQVNVRLRKGEKGWAIAGWLNSLPEVRAVLVEEFGGVPVREQNLSEWRKGGYLYWLRVQEAQEMMVRIGPDAAALNEAAKEPVTETLATWLAARYVVAAKSAEGLGGDQGSNWDRMREFCHDVMALRRGEHLAQRLEFEREKLETAKWKMDAVMNSGTPHPDLLPSEGRRNNILGMLTQGSSVRHLATAGLDDVTPLGYSRCEDGNDGRDLTGKKEFTNEKCGERSEGEHSTFNAQL